MKVEIESELVSNGETWEIFLKLSYLKNQFFLVAAMLKMNVIFLHDLTC